MRPGYGEVVYLSIEQAKDAFSAWSEAELEEAVKTLREVLEAKRSAQGRRDIPN